jgi:hypothetical protein
VCHANAINCFPLGSQEAGAAREQSTLLETIYLYFDVFSVIDDPEPSSSIAIHGLGQAGEGIETAAISTLQVLSRAAPGGTCRRWREGPYAWVVWE